MKTKDNVEFELGMTIYWVDEWCDDPEVKSRCIDAPQFGISGGETIVKYHKGDVVSHHTLCSVYLEISEVYAVKENAIKEVVAKLDERIRQLEHIKQGHLNGTMNILELN